MVCIFMVMRRTLEPRLAAEAAASQPACPAPTTITSYLGNIVVQNYQFRSTWNGIRFLILARGDQKCSTWNICTLGVIKGEVFGFHFPHKKLFLLLFIPATSQIQGSLKVDPMYFLLSRVVDLNRIIP